MQLITLYSVRPPAVVFTGNTHWIVLASKEEERSIVKRKGNVMMMFGLIMFFLFLLSHCARSVKRAFATCSTTPGGVNGLPVCHQDRAIVTKRPQTFLPVRCHDLSADSTFGCWFRPRCCAVDVLGQCDDAFIFWREKHKRQMHNLNHHAAPQLWYTRGTVLHTGHST